MTMRKNRAAAPGRRPGERLKAWAAGGLPALLPRGARLAAAGALLALAIVVAGQGPRGWTISLLLPVMHAWDSAHMALDPHEPFTRAASRADKRPLSVQNREMLEDMRARFLIEDDSLALMNVREAHIGDLCLWQGVYTAAAVWTQLAEPSAKNARYAERAVEGLAVLASKGLPIARAVLPKDLPTEPGGRWFYIDGRRAWKEDASIDSAAGWVLGAVVAAEFLPSRRARALRLLRGFTDTLIEGGYSLRNSDGTKTRYHAMGGDTINSPVGVLVTLAALRTLDRAGAGERYGREHRRLLGEGQHRWGAFGSAPFFWWTKHSNHNIAFLALSAALISEDDPAVRRVYESGMTRLMRLTRNEGNSFWTYLSHWSMAARAQGGRLPGNYSAELVRALPGAKTSMLEWRYPVSKRKRWTYLSEIPEVEFVRWPFTLIHTPAQPVPIWRRPPADFVWQRSPYGTLDWRGYMDYPPDEFSPLDFTAAYALGRLTGGIGPGE